MSEHSSSSPRPFIPGQVYSWLGFAGFILLAILVLVYAYISISPSNSAEKERRVAQKTLRAETETKAHSLVNQSKRNPDGTYHLPIDTTIALIVENPAILVEMHKPAAAKPAMASPAPSSANAFVKADDETMKRGLAVYSRTCIACHQANGMGLAPVFPPLANSSIAVGDATLPIKFILHGLMGPLTVGGTTYNSMMPAVAGVNDQEIADVLTYVRQSFGNQGTLVTSDQVKAVREANASRTTPWTTTELGLK
jgi:mono/diheme cytochrome c family protein